MKIDNVCFVPSTKYAYDKEPQVDFFIVEIKQHNVRVASVYVGANPELHGKNQRLLEETYVHSHLGQRIWLSKPQENQLLGIPAHPESEEYFHIMIVRGTVDRNEIAKLVKFC